MSKISSTNFSVDSPQTASSPLLASLSQRVQQRVQQRGAEPVRVLMVCTGNICRSPTAHGVLQKMVADAGLAQRIEVDSAGTHGYHVGDAPDQRSQQHAVRRGYDLSQHRARQLQAADFEHFDLVLIMDEANQRAAGAISPPERRAHLQRLTDYCQTLSASAVPDPYYGGAAGFEQVLDLVEDACTGLLKALISVEKADKAGNAGTTSTH